MLTYVYICIRHVHFIPPSTALALDFAKNTMNMNHLGLHSFNSRNDRRVTSG